MTHLRFVVRVFSVVFVFVSFVSCVSGASEVSSSSKVSRLVSICEAIFCSTGRSSDDSSDGVAIKNDPASRVTCSLCRPLPIELQHLVRRTTDKYTGAILRETIKEKIERYLSQNSNLEESRDKNNSYVETLRVRLDLSKQYGLNSEDYRPEHLGSTFFNEGNHGRRYDKLFQKPFFYFKRWLEQRLGRWYLVSSFPRPVFQEMKAISEREGGAEVGIGTHSVIEKNSDTAKLNVITDETEKFSKSWQDRLRFLEMNRRGSHTVQYITSQRVGFWRHPAICFRDIVIWLNYRDEWVWAVAEITSSQSIDNKKGDATKTTKTNILLLAAVRRCQGQYGQLFRVDGADVGADDDAGKNSDTRKVFYICAPVSCEAEIVAREVALFVIQYQLVRELFVDQTLLGERYYGSYIRVASDGDSELLVPAKTLSLIPTTLSLKPSSVQAVVPQIRNYELSSLTFDSAESSLTHHFPICMHMPVIVPLSEKNSASDAALAYYASKSGVTKREVVKVVLGVLEDFLKPADQDGNGNPVEETNKNFGPNHGRFVKKMIKLRTLPSSAGPALTTTNVAFPDLADSTPYFTHTEIAAYIKSDIKPYVSELSKSVESNLSLIGSMPKVLKDILPAVLTDASLILDVVNTGWNGLGEAVREEVERKLSETSALERNITEETSSAQIWNSPFLQKSLIKINRTEYFGAPACRNAKGTYVKCYSDDYDFQKGIVDTELLLPVIKNPPPAVAAPVTSDSAQQGSQPSGSETKAQKPKPVFTKLRFGLGINVHLIADLFKPQKHEKLERASSALQYGQKVSGVMSFWNQAGIRYLKTYGVEMYLLMSSPSKEEFEIDAVEEVDEDKEIPGEDIVFDKEKYGKEKKTQRKTTTVTVVNDEDHRINERSADAKSSLFDIRTFPEDSRPTPEQLVELLSDPNYVDVLSDDTDIENYEEKYYKPEQRIWVRNRAGDAAAVVADKTMYTKLDDGSKPSDSSGDSEPPEPPEEPKTNHANMRSFWKREDRTAEYASEFESSGIEFMRELEKEAVDAHGAVEEKGKPTTHRLVSEYVARKYAAEPGKSNDLKSRYSQISCRFPSEAAGTSQVSPEVPIHLRNLCMSPNYPLTRKQAQLLKSWEINVIHYPVKRKIIQKMHKSHWRTKAANAWRYGLPAMLRFAFLELAELGGFDAMLVMELDMVLFNPFRVLYFMQHVGNSGRRKDTYSNGKTSRATKITNKLLRPELSTEDVSSNHVFVTNGDFHYVHEGLLIFSKVGNVDSDFEWNWDKNVNTKLELSDALTTNSENIRLTQKDLGDSNANPSVFLTDLARKKLSIYRQFLLLLKYTPVTSTSINNNPKTARADMHSGHKYYEENGIGAGVFYYMFAQVGIQKIKVLDRCEWNYFLENQFRQKFRSIGGDGYHELKVKSGSVADIEGAEGKYYEQSPILKWYEEHFSFATADLDFEQKKYKRLQEIDWRVDREDFPKTDAEGGASEEQALTFHFSVNKWTSTNGEEASNINTKTTPLLPPPFPSHLQPRWCSAVSLRPSANFKHAAGGLCLQWPIEVSDFQEDRTDRCRPEKGPPAIIHKLDRELLMYLDFFVEEKKHCEEYGIG